MCRRFESCQARFVPPHLPTQPLLKRAGLPAGTRMHDLRHSAATLLLSKGVAVRAVAEMLGHADASSTLSIYAHLLPDMRGIAADAADQTLG